MKDIQKIKEFFSKPLEENKQLDQVDFAKVVKAVKSTGHPATVMLVPKWNEIEIITGMNAPDEMIYDISKATSPLGYSSKELSMSGDSSSLGRGEYSEIEKVNGGHMDYRRFEESVNETEFKKGDKVTYLGHPAEITSVEDRFGKIFLSVSYDKGQGKTKVRGILSTDGSVKPLKEAKEEYFKPLIRKDKSNPNFLYVDIAYPEGSDVLSVGGSKTMGGQDREAGAAKALAMGNNIAKKLQAKYNIEDIDVSDLKNGKVEVFAVSDDFIKMVSPSLDETTDFNDPVLMKFRAAKDRLAKTRAANAGDDGNDKFFRNAKKIAALKAKRAEIMRDMEQEAEPEGGPIADKYGDMLNVIDAEIAKEKAMFNLEEAQFTDYTNQELAAYVKNTKDKEAAKELHKRSQKLKNLSRTDINEGGIEDIKKQLDALGVKYEMSGNKFRPFKAIYKPLNKSDKWYDEFEDIIYLFNLGSAVKQSMDESLTAGYPHRKTSGEGFEKIVIVEPMDDATRERMIRRFEAEGWDAKPNNGGGITAIKKTLMNETKSEDKVDTITMDIPLFLRMLEYSREDASQDMDLHDVTEKANKLGKERGILSMEDYEEIVGAAEDTPKEKINEAKSFTIDSESAFDSDKITDFLTQNNISFKKVGSKIKISLDRDTPKASVILSKLNKLAKFDELNEAELTEAYVPSNIKEFAKRKGVSSLVNKVAGWAEKVGKSITGGTAIGYNYSTLILDMEYQGSEIRINTDNDTVTLYNKPVYSFNDFKRIYLDNQDIEENVAPNHKGKAAPYGSGYKPLEEKIAEALDKINEELCPAGKAYIKRRKAAGEKSSAYLSGRAVKVCKGQMSGKAKKKK